MARPVRVSRSTWLLIAIAVTALVIKLWLAGAISLRVNQWAHHDDLWFLSAAESILAGDWLGEYSEMTLIKGPGYPLWLALVASLGLPLLVAQQLLYAAACGALAQALAPIVRPGVRCILFVLLLFNPVTVTVGVATRIIREGVYPALAMLVVAGAFGCVLRLNDSPIRWRSWLWLGAVAAPVFWWTREEGVWLTPALAAAFVLLTGWLATDWRLRWRRALELAAVPAVLLAAAHVGLVATHAWRYDVPAVVELKHPAFLDAYGSLTRVHHRETIPRVPVPRETRQRIYAASPAFRELEPFLEGEIGARWARSWPKAEGEIAGGWFMWALRKAVAAAGYYERGGEAVLAYYRRLAKEVDAACDSGQLEAGPARSTMVPPLEGGQLREVATAVAQGGASLLQFSSLSFDRMFSTGSHEVVERYARLTRSRLAPRIEGASLVAKGWAFKGDDPLDLSIHGPDGRPLEGAVVKRSASPGVYDYFQRRGEDLAGARTARFVIEVPSVDRATLVLSEHGETIERLPLWVDPLRSRAQGVHLWVDEATYEPAAGEPAARSSDRLRRDVLRGVADIYERTFLPLAALALLLYGAGSLRSRTAGWQWRTGAVVIAGLVAPVLARLAILALIHVTSFPAMHPLYLAPAYPLVIVVVVIMADHGVRGWTRSWPRGAAPSACGPSDRAR